MRIITVICINHYRFLGKREALIRQKPLKVIAFDADEQVLFIFVIREKTDSGLLQIFSGIFEYMKIVIAIDSFKGCLSSAELADIIAQAAMDISQSVEIVKMPVADGGEGWVNALTSALGGVKVSCRVNGPLREPVDAVYGWIEQNKRAIIEMASASGLSLVSPQKRNIMAATTVGTGELIADALSRGCRHILLGLGGSATNDAGIGMLQALGFRFFDAAGNRIGDGGATLNNISYIDTSGVNPLLSGCRIDVATDVRNPFYGADGAAYVFAPQKGATEEQVKVLDDGLRHLAELIKTLFGIDLQTCEGSGAAGGMGGCCKAFFGASLLSGIALVKEILHFDDIARSSDLIITGEGRIDSQTVGGKLLSGIMDTAKKCNVPVIALTGDCYHIPPQLEYEPLLSVFPIQPAPVSLETAVNPVYAKRQIERTIHSIMKLVKFEKNLVFDR